MAKVKVYCMYGLGGRMWSAPVEDVIAATIRTFGPDFSVPPTISWSNWRSIVEDIKKQPPGVKKVVLGHSMGGASVTYVTDYVKIDLGISYDCAGQVPSKIGSNTAKMLVYRSTAWAIVPRFDIYPVSAAYANRVTKYSSAYSHTGIVVDPSLNRITYNAIKELAK